MLVDGPGRGRRGKKYEGGDLWGWDSFVVYRPMIGNISENVVNGHQATRHGNGKLVKTSPRRDAVTWRQKFIELFSLDIDPGELLDLSARYSG